MAVGMIENGVFGNEAYPDDPVLRKKFREDMDERYKLQEEINPLIKRGVVGDDITMTVRYHHRGLQFVFEYKTHHVASVILNDGSYGNEKALFEIMISPPESWGEGHDGVRGNLTFFECLLLVRNRAMELQKQEEDKKP